MFPGEDALFQGYFVFVTWKLPIFLGEDSLFSWNIPVISCNLPIFPVGNFKVVKVNFLVITWSYQSRNILVISCKLPIFPGYMSMFQVNFLVITWKCLGKCCSLWLWHSLDFSLTFFYQSFQENSLFQWNVLVISWKLLSLQGTVPRKLPSYYLKVTSLSRGKLPIFAEGLLLSPGDFPSCLKVTNFCPPTLAEGDY